MKARSWRCLALLVVAPPLLPAALAPGGEAYTKRAQTALLAAPQMLASPVAQLAYAQKLKVEELKGNWVRVSDGKRRGWIFAGNLADEKPSENRGLDGLPVAASETSAATAARPLVPATEEYSARRGLAEASADLIWLAEQRAAVSAAAVQEFLQEKKKGEYQ